MEAVFSFFHNFPFISIILSMVCATVTSILPARHARRLARGGNAAFVAAGAGRVRAGRTAARGV